MSRFYSLLMVISIVLLCLTIGFGQDFNLPKEKVYIHTDRMTYAPEEIIYYSAYLISENDEDTPSSKVLYVELIDSESNYLR